MTGRQHGSSDGATAEATASTSRSSEDRASGVSPRRVRPWPSHHEPRTAGERRLWESFEDLRVDPASELSQKLVASRIGMSRTPLSVGKDGFALLREAIQDEIARRAEEKTSSRPEAPTAAEARAAEQARREQSVRYWRSLAQRNDSLIVAAHAEAARDREARERAVRLLRKILDHFREGRWIRADQDDGLLRDAEALLVEGGSAATDVIPVAEDQCSERQGHAAPDRHARTRRGKPGLLRDRDPVG
ncbi:hypothetical protein NF701_09010 [Sphingomonadaceae bacterium OTU29THOMA1]|nr:hypothetical protein NF701_09010 [Sphingomonadaceae bacterium OTU29THOMA1]